ncbi:hypothetical protein FRB91_008119, partial [Serendipita sp. 411]
KPNVLRKKGWRLSVLSKNVWKLNARRRNAWRPNAWNLRKPSRSDWRRKRLRRSVRRPNALNKSGWRLKESSVNDRKRLNGSRRKSWRPKKLLLKRIKLTLPNQKKLLKTRVTKLIRLKLLRSPTVLMKSIALQRNPSQTPHMNLSRMQRRSQLPMVLMSPRRAKKVKRQKYFWMPRMNLPKSMRTDT